jgi:hypothetical protein
MNPRGGHVRKLLRGWQSEVGAHASITRWWTAKMPNSVAGRCGWRRGRWSPPADRDRRRQRLDPGHPRHQRSDALPAGTPRPKASTLGLELGIGPIALRSGRRRAQISGTILLPVPLRSSMRMRPGEARHHGILVWRQKALTDACHRLRMVIVVPQPRTKAARHRMPRFLPSSRLRFSVEQSHASGRSRPSATRSTADCVHQ